MSALQLRNTNCSENEYLAENTLITVTSGVDHPVFRFISGYFGPLISGMPCQIPIWLAITLRKKGKCTIQIPDWMKVESLEQRALIERTQSTLGDLPFHYIEIAQLLLNNARDDINSPDKVAVLLQDLENIRMDRIKQGVMSIGDSVNRHESVIYAALHNASALEIFAMKRFFLGSMDVFYWLCPPTIEGVDEDSRNENSNNNNNTLANGNRKLRRFRNN
jgi:GINS complex subunit 2